MGASSLVIPVVLSSSTLAGVLFPNFSLRAARDKRFIKWVFQKFGN